MAIPWDPRSTGTSPGPQGTGGLGGPALGPPSIPVRGSCGLLCSLVACGHGAMAAFAHPGAVVPGLHLPGQALAVDRALAATTRQNSSQSDGAGKSQWPRWRSTSGGRGRAASRPAPCQPARPWHRRTSAAIVVETRLMPQRMPLLPSLDSGRRRAEHHQARPPPAVHRVLHHRPCSGVPSRIITSRLSALALVEASHGRRGSWPGIGARSCSGRSAPGS